MMYFVSDLDKTLIYSKCPNEVCVEKKDKQEITYITQKAVSIFKQLISDESFYFIPCTLRSIEQTMRINFIKDNNLKYIICDNGASIYIDGKLDKKWDEKINSIINKDKVVLLRQNIEKYVENNNINIKMIKSNRNCFLTIIFNTEEESEKNIDRILSFVDSYFNIFKQGKKTYIVPKSLNKSIAVNYLKNEYNISNIITSGDSSVDDKFVELGDIVILPSHSVFKVKNAIITKASGIKAGEEILSTILNIKNKKHFS